MEATLRAPTDADVEELALLLGRSPAGAFQVAVRRVTGKSVGGSTASVGGSTASVGGSIAVISNSPLLFDGTPMPTRYWLVDRELRDEVARIESDGGVREAEAAVDPGELEAAHQRYSTERDRLIPAGHAGPLPHGGVGGTRRGVKCLHAHLAWYLAGGDDPVGRWTAERIEARLEG